MNQYVKILELQMIMMLNFDIYIHFFDPVGVY